VSKCDKPLDRIFIRKNYDKYFTAKNKPQGHNVVGSDNRSKNKGQDRKKNNADPVSSQHKKGVAVGIQLIGSTTP
jgi:hypothetical protein